MRWQNGPQQGVSYLRIRTDRAGVGGGVETVFLESRIDQAGRA